MKTRAFSGKRSPVAISSCGPADRTPRCRGPRLAAGGGRRRTLGVLAALLVAGGGFAACTSSDGTTDTSSSGSGGAGTTASSSGSGGGSGGGGGGGGSSSGTGSSGGTSSGSSSGSSGGSSGGSGGGSGGSSGGSGDDGGPGPGMDGTAPGDGGGDGGLWATPMDGGPMTTGPSVTGTVTVDPGTTVSKLPPGFVGFSYEKSHLTNAFFTGSNAPLIAMFKLLGPSILRLGGNSVDVTSWSPDAPPTTGGAIGTTIGTADVDGLRDFLDATGWRSIYAVGLKSSTPAAAATEATYAAGKLGSTLAGFEVGNEIDLYGLSYSQLVDKWNGEADAIIAAVPNAVLTGPATAGHSLIPNFAKDEAGRISLLTQHYYRGDGHAASSTLAELLAPDPGLLSMLQVMSTAATTNSISGGYRIDECNSFYNHGAPNVSNTFGAALWVIDYLFTNALNGSQGANFHGGGPGQDGSTPFLYTPITEANGVVTGIQPIFYGMLLVTLTGTGDVLSTTAKAGSLNFTAYAVHASDGSTNVVIVNKDATSDVQASVDLGASVGSASAVYLQASSLTATDGVTLAGGSVSPAGAWTPSAPWALPVAGHVVTATVPAASAVLIHAQ